MMVSRRPQRCCGKVSWPPCRTPGWHGHGKVPVFGGQEITFAAKGTESADSLQQNKLTRASCENGVSVYLFLPTNSDLRALRDADAWVTAAPALPVVTGGVTTFVWRHIWSPWLLKQTLGLLV